MCKRLTFHSDHIATNHQKKELTFISLQWIWIEVMCDIWTFNEISQSNGFFELNLRSQNKVKIEILKLYWVLCPIELIMSTRWYPIYQKGNPQLRVFLPNFWMKMIRPENTQPDNVVCFKVSMEMTKYDVENYLREIYKVPVVEVRTRIAMGEFYQDKYKKYVKKKDDDKIAYVTLVRTSAAIDSNASQSLHHFYGFFFLLLFNFKFTARRC